MLQMLQQRGIQLKSESLFKRSMTKLREKQHLENQDFLMAEKYHFLCDDTCLFYRYHFQSFQLLQRASQHLAPALLKSAGLRELKTSV